MVTKEDKINWLKDIVKINTTEGNESEVANYINNLLNQEGIETTLIEYAPGRTQLVANLTGSREGGEKTIVLSGHMDVVPADPAEWNYNPFGAEEVDGKIYGRGTSDMKGALLAAVIAMINLKQNNSPFAGTVRLLATIGEETGSLGAKQLKKLGYTDNVDGIIVGEPSINNVVNAEKGTFWLRLTTIGQTAHGSAPYAGINAINHMRAFLDKFDEKIDFSSYKNELLGTATASINTINGGDAVNTIPGKCITEIDIRTVPELDTQIILDKIEEINQELKKTLPKFHLTVEIVSSLPATYSDFNDSFIQAAVSAIEEVTGVQQISRGAYGATDLGIFLDTDTPPPGILLGCGNAYIIHQVNEYIEIEQYLKGIQIYETLIKKFLV